MVWVLVARSVAGLAAVTVLIPVCIVFVLADHRLLDAWRTELLASWVASDIDFAALSSAIRANPALPKNTIEGMLATLPSLGGLVAEQGVPSVRRRAIAAEVVSRQRSLGRLLACSAFVGALGTVSLVGAVVGRSEGTSLWVPLGVTLLATAMIGGRVRMESLVSRISPTVPPSPPGD
jgi:hypothetical protein